MSDEAKKEDDTQTPVIYWHDHVPTIFADAILANAYTNGIHRIVLGEVVFDPAPGATIPAMRPSANLVVSANTLKLMLRDIASYEGVREDE
jgi:hypothetical protein